MSETNDPSAPPSQGTNSPPASPSPPPVQPPVQPPTPAAAPPTSPPAPTVPDKPEDYGLAKPQTWPAALSFDDAAPAYFAEIFKDAGITKEQSGKLWDRLTAFKAAEMQAAVDAETKARASAKQMLDTAWGVNRPIREEAALRASAYVFGGAWTQVLKEMGAEANPELFIGLAKIAGEIGEHRVTTAAPAPAVDMTPQDWGTLMYPVTAAQRAAGKR